MAAWPAWVLWILGGALSLAGLGLLGWALFWDRARGRRRCPGCWYDMSASTPTCPECGRTVPREASLFRTHRRWRWAVLALAVLIAGAALGATPWLRGGRWHAWIPTTGVVLALPWIDDPWPWDELDRRLEYSAPGLSWARPHALWSWQQRLLVRRCAAALDAGLSSPIKPRTLRRLLEASPDPGPAAAAVARRLQDEDPKVRGLASWGIKATRYDWGNSRAMLIEALRAAPDDTDRWGHSNRNLALAALEQVGGALPAAPNDPDALVRFLNGASSRELTAVHRALGVSSTMLTWPYDGESGPFQVRAFELGADCRAIRIGDQGGAHWEMLVLRRRENRWLCAGLIEVGNQMPRPPEPRSVQAPDGRTWLVIRACGGSGGPGYAVFYDTWITLDDGLKRSMSQFVEGHHMGAGAVGGDWEVTSDAPTLINESAGLILRYPLRVHIPTPPTMGPPRSGETPSAGDLLIHSLTLTYQWNGCMFIREPQTHPWAGASGVEEVLLAGPQELLAVAGPDLVRIAKDASESQKAALRAAITPSSPFEQQDELLRLLRASEAEHSP
jgi:hypothetical protein